MLSVYKTSPDDQQCSQSLPCGSFVHKNGFGSSLGYPELMTRRLISRESCLTEVYVNLRGCLTTEISQSALSVEGRSVSGNSFGVSLWVRNRFRDVTELFLTVSVSNWNLHPYTS